MKDLNGLYREAIALLGSEELSLEESYIAREAITIGLRQLMEKTPQQLDEILKENWPGYAKYSKLNNDETALTHGDTFDVLNHEELANPLLKSWYFYGAIYSGLFDVRAYHNAIQGESWHQGRSGIDITYSRVWPRPELVLGQTLIDNGWQFRDGDNSDPIDPAKWYEPNDHYGYEGPIEL